MIIRWLHSSARRGEQDCGASKNMDLADLNIVKQILHKHGLRPRKGYGQNFLVDKNVLDDIVEAADLKKDDTVVEVGPGIGTLTVELAKRVKKVIAIEADRNMVEILRETVGEFKNVEIILGDILKTTLALRATPPSQGGENNHPFLKEETFKVVANLPYNITSAVLRKFLTAENKPELLVLMAQKEVAERICARPASASRSGATVGKPGQMSLLSLSVQFYGEPEITRLVSRTSFFPAPAVDSAVVKITTPSPLLRKEGIVATSPEKLNKVAGGAKHGIAASPRWASGLLAMTNKTDEKWFWQLAKIGFSARRKMLANNLAGGFRIGKKEAEDWLKKSGMGITCRAQELGVADWVKLLENKPGSD